MTFTRKVQKKECSNIYLMYVLQVVSEASLTTQGFLPADGSGLVVGLKDLAELESACLATAGGDVVLFNLNTWQVRFTGSFLLSGLIQVKVIWQARTLIECVFVLCS